MPACHQLLHTRQIGGSDDVARGARLNLGHQCCRRTEVKPHFHLGVGCLKRFSQCCERVGKRCRCRDRYLAFQRRSGGGRRNSAHGANAHHQHSDYPPHCHPLGMISNNETIRALLAGSNSSRPHHRAAPSRVCATQRAGLGRIAFLCNASASASRLSLYQLTPGSKVHPPKQSRAGRPGFCANRLHRYRIRKAH